MKTFLYSILVILVLGILTKLNAQTCSPGTITTQAQVLDVATNCTVISGDLIIEGGGITDLDTFYVITEVTGDVIVRNCSNLNSLQGLDGIVTIGGDFIVENSSITSFGGFGYLLSSIGGSFRISSCAQLEAVNIFSSLSTIGGNLEVWNSGSLMSFDLNILTSIGQGISFLSNGGNFNLNGFENLTSVSSGIQLADNTGLRELNGFDALGSTTTIFVTNNGVQKVNGFSSLTSASIIDLTDNSFLEEIDGFSSLTSAPNYISINNNGGLISFTGFGSLQTTGNLRIENNGQIARSPGFSIDLNTFNNLTTIVNDLRIIGNFVFTGISGFTSLQNCLNIDIEGNEGLGTIIGFSAFNRIRNTLVIKDNPGLTTLTGFQSLQNIDDFFRIMNNDMLSNLGNFNSVQTGVVIIDGNAALTNISGFTAHTSGGVGVTLNPELTSISAWQNLMGNGSMVISMNAKLASVDGFQNFTTNTESVSIVGNPMLSMCCWALPALNSAVSPTVSGNAAGCADLGQIDQAPVLNNCPADLTVNVVDGQCFTIVDLTDPTITDNCGYVSYIIELTVGTETISDFAIEGAVFTYELVTGTNLLQWTVTDESGNNDNCQTIVTVIDNQVPTFDAAIPEDVTVSVDASSCSVTQSIVFPTFSDNCPGVFTRLTVFDNVNSFTSIYDNQSPTGGTSYDVTLAPGDYTVEYSLEDANNNSRVETSFIEVRDNTGPVITLNQGDVTVSCNETPPAIPQIGSSVFATDGCDGDVTSNMTQTSSITVGDCTFGQEQELTTVTYTASDNNGNMTQASFTITVINDEAVELGSDQVGCTGESLTLSTQGLDGTYAWSTGATTPTILVSTAGTYSVTVTGISGCCSIDEVNVSFQDIPDASANGGVLGCTSTEVQITGSSTTNNVAYSWSGPGGFSSNLQNPTVSSLGNYSLTVTTSAGCIATATAQVTADTDVPDANATGGNLDCSNSEVQLMASSTTSGVTYLWSGPSGFTSAMQNPIVTDAGVYTLTVAAQNGCSVSIDAEVIDDTSAPVLTIPGGEINCNTESLTLTPDITGDVLTYEWSGPGGLTASSSTLQVSEGGDYNLTVTGVNTCTTSTTVTIGSDTNVPNISAEGATLDCSSSQVSLNGNSTTPDVTYHWNGPDGFEANVANPAVVSTGTYTLIVTAPNGCSDSTSVDVTSDTELPSVSVGGGTLTCNVPEITLEASSDDEGLIYAWTGPDNFTSDSAVITVVVPGLYTVIVTNEGGCSAQAMAQVMEDSDLPTIQVEAEGLDCSSTMTTPIVSASDDVTAYLWTGPEGFASDEAQPVITVAGTYSLTVIADNGCTESMELVVSTDTSVPDINVEGGSLSCNVNSVILQSSSTTENISYFWSGPDNYTSNEQNPVATQAGTYILTITAENGCTSEASVDVTADTDLPNVSAQGGVLDCNNSEVTLLGSSTTEGASSSWSGPDNFMSSENNPVVTVAGEYTFTVTNATGCSTFKMVIVEENLETPTVSLSLGDVSCEDGTITINPNIIDDFSFTWTGPNGFTSNEAIPAVSLQGEYRVTVIGENGCSFDTLFTLENDVEFGLEVNVEGTDATVEITGGYGPFTILWDDGTEGVSVDDLSSGEHTVSVVDVFGCEQVTVFNVTSTSTEDIVEVLRVKVYPNPSVDYLNVEWKNTKGKLEMISVFDRSGQLMSRVKTTDMRSSQNTRINVQDWAPGIYVIKFNGEHSAGYQKFVKI